MRKPRARWVFAATAVVAVVVAVLVSVVFEPGSSKGGSVDNSFPTKLTTVRRESLSEQSQQSATLGYADPSTIDIPSGSAPSDVQQAQQQVTTATAQLATAQASLAADERTLAESTATASADRQKLAVDCAGDNAGGSAASSSPTAGGGGSTPCAGDSQTMSTDEQSLAQAGSKVAADRQGVSSAETGLASAQTALSEVDSTATVYGQSATYTELPAEGQIVGRGQTLDEIGGRPAVVLYGSVAAWRAFAPGMSPGEDVAELNANLRALGYGAPAGDAFTGATSTAIDAFQSARGMTATGGLLLGSVVFEPGAVRVTSVTPTLGSTVQPGAAFSVTSTRRVVTIELDAAEQSEVAVGDAVDITLPNDDTTPGRVTYVGKVATTPSSSDQGNGGGGSSSPTVEVDVTPTDPRATGTLDQAPVNVSITEQSVKDVLVVPVDALLALASGGYAIEEVTGGVHHLVGVDLGLFDDAAGLVQISGSGIAPGQKVVIPNE